MLLLPRNTCSWAISQAETFRNKSRKLFGEFGTNLQNPSERICQIYKPDSGKEFIQADCAGAEALIVAYLCPPGNFRDLFLNGIKPHVFVAMHIFAKQWEEELKLDMAPFLAAKVSDLKNIPRWAELAKAIKDHDVRYYCGKKSCHSFNYRQSANSYIFVILKETEGKVVLSLQEGKRHKAVYEYLFPEIQHDWHMGIDEVLNGPKILFNLFGHPREFYTYGPITEKHKREATAWVPQSTVGTITNKAFADNQCYIEANKLEWDLLNNKHDSILCQAPESESLECARLLSTSLEQELVSPRGERFKMKSEVSIGKNWGKYDEVKNPEGMKEIKI
jgi:hypothetical protein